MGLHNIEWNGQRVHFSVIANMFPVPHKELNHIYTFHPSTVHEVWGNRWLKMGTRAELGVIGQILSDIDALESFGHTDYKLVVGMLYFIKLLLVTTPQHTIS